MSAVVANSLFSPNTAPVQDTAKPENDYLSIPKPQTSEATPNLRDPPPIEDIADDGELIISIGTDEDERRFRTSAHCMRHASPVWKPMLDPAGKWPEARHNRVSFPDDHPESLYILISIAHLRFDLLPTMPAVETVSQLVTVADKYGLIELLRPFMSSWCYERSEFKDHEYWIRLKVAWVMGDRATFERQLHGMVRGLRRAEVDGERDDYWVDHKGHRIPNDEYESIMGPWGISWRRIAFRSLCKPFHNRIHSLTTTRCCQTRRFFKQCDSIVLGSLIRALSAVKLWPLPHPEYVRASLSDVEERLVSALDHLYTPKDAFHKDCRKQEEMRQEVRGVWMTMPNLIDAYHIRHLERQKSKPLARRPRSFAQVKKDEDAAKAKNDENAVLVKMRGMKLEDG